MAQLHRSAMALLLVLIISSSGVNAQLREFRLSHQWAEETDARDRAARVFAVEVQKRIPAVKVTVHARSSLGINSVEQYDAILDGRVEMAVYPLFYAADKVPEFAIGNLPGVPPDADAAKLLKGSAFSDRLQAYAEDAGLHILTWWWLGGGIASTKREIAGPETVVGLKVRGGDKLFDLMLAKAGAIIQTMPSSEIANRIGDGTLDVAFTSYESFVSFKIYERAKFATLGGTGIWTSFTPLVMSRAAWNRLTDAEQAAFTEAAEISETHFEESQRKALNAALEAFSKAGVKVRQLSFEEYSAWLNVAKDTSWRTYRDISPLADDLLSSMIQIIMSNGARGTATKKTVQ
jgi:TRAP-type transport system periplasmic protein